MNTIALQGSLHSAPELRHTHPRWDNGGQDGMAQASAMLTFPSSKPEEADYTIRLVCFGNLAEEFHQTFKVGDSLVVEGRLQSESRAKPDGNKERVVELIARHAHPLAASTVAPPQAKAVPPAQPKPESEPRAKPTPPSVPAAAARTPAARTAPKTITTRTQVQGDDDVPF